MILKFFFASVAFEQIIFLYFNFFSTPILGARLIQLAVLFFIFFFKPKYITFNFKKIDKTYFYFFVFIFLGFFISIYNLIMGNFFTAFSQGVTQNVFFNEILFKIIRETGTYLYFFFIFVLLFNRIVKSPELLNSFFIFYRNVFITSIYIGFFLYIYYYFYGFNLLPRQLNYGFESQIAVDVGLRFMGLFGEPRDASVCLMIGLGIITLEQIHLLNLKLISSFQKSYIFNTFIILIAFFLTNSGSSLIAMVIFFMLFSFITITIIKINLRTITILLLGTIFLAIIFTGSRTKIYYNEILKLPLYMSGVNEENDVLQNQFNNILPIWLMYENFKNFDLAPLVVGNGFGSSAYVSYAHLGNYYSDFENPHSQITRIIFETGLFGSFLWYLVYMGPLFRFRKILNRKYFVILSGIFTLSFSALLAHRNPEMFLLLGVTLSVLKQYNEKNVRLKK